MIQDATILYFIQ